MRILTYNVCYNMGRWHESKNKRHIWIFILQNLYSGAANVNHTRQTISLTLLVLARAQSLPTKTDTFHSLSLLRMYTAKSILCCISDATARSSLRSIDWAIQKSKYVCYSFQQNRK